MRSELRQDITTGDWVIIAPERGKRLQHACSETSDRRSIPRFDPTCPFCPGNEKQLPGIIAEIRGAGPPGWQVRVVPNKYPALTPDSSRALNLDGRSSARGGYGFHDVVIESPDHNADLASMSDAAITTVLFAYHRRFAELLERPDIESVILFRNHGSASGASLTHPHAQLVAMNTASPRLVSAAEWTRRYYREHARCATCDDLDLQRNSGKHIIEETRSFVTLVPFAATVPSEIWIVPKRHQALFTEVEEIELIEFSALLRRTLWRIKALHHDPPYKFAFDSGRKGERHAAHLHWRLRIAPDLVTWGGFELGTRLPINPSSPEHDAEALRSVHVPEQVEP